LRKPSSECYSCKNIRTYLENSVADDIRMMTAMRLSIESRDVAASALQALDFLTPRRSKGVVYGERVSDCPGATELHLRAVSTTSTTASDDANRCHGAGD
jgi:hypothetical protein